MDFLIKTNILYPPFRESASTLEENIYDNWDNKYDDIELPLNTILLKINWTNITNQWIKNNRNQEYIESIIQYIKELDKTKTYIIISQHDDLIPLPLLEFLPPHTIIFNAGGNIRKKNIIPIPLTYIPTEIYKYNPPSYIQWNNMCYDASFIGSNTNNMRKQLDMYLFNNSKYNIKIHDWQEQIDPINISNYLDSFTNSKFILAPSGYGPTSFRFYEAFINCRIPVYIYDDNGPFLPYNDNIDWYKCSIIIHWHDIQKLPQILSKITYDQYIKMLEYYNVFHQEFMTITGITTYIKNFMNKIYNDNIWTPQNIACIANKNAYQDLILMLKSLEIYNITPPNIYIFCDSYIAEQIGNNIKYSGCVKKRIELDKYNNYTRKEMEQMTLKIIYNNKEYSSCLWNEFMLKKIEVLKWALDDSKMDNGVFFSDTDICYFAALPNIINPIYKLFVSPHYINNISESQFGIYNGGFLWIKNYEILALWYEASLSSTFYEQKALENLVAYYKNQNAVLYGDMNINYGWWRMFESSKEPKELQNNWKQKLSGFLNSGIYINEKPLQSIHTHFFDNANNTNFIKAFNHWILIKLHNYPFYPNNIILNIIMKKSNY